MDIYTVINSQQTNCRILIIDDLYGRSLTSGINFERKRLCAKFKLRDVTPGIKDQIAADEFIADVVFCRGQIPVKAKVGDIVRNDIDGTMSLISTGWDRRPIGTPPWALILLDLCFLTGEVTNESEKDIYRGEGLPIGNPDDDDENNCFGHTLLKAIVSRFPDLPVVLFSSLEEERFSHIYSHEGALAFIPKAGRDSASRLKRILNREGLIQDLSNKIIGTSIPLLKTLRGVRRLTNKSNFLLLGERGTGKEVLAKYAHELSQVDKERSFVSVNTPSLTDTMFASELFGVKKGTATGVEAREGLISEADGGDLFLDELKDTPSVVQDSLLRVIQEGEITPVGARIPKKVKVRFISATNKDISYLVDEVGFREDLLDRLTVGGVIKLPALRERKDDIPSLFQYYLRIAENEIGGVKGRKIEDEAMKLLLDYKWPGNVRELKNIVNQIVTNFSEVPYIVTKHLLSLGINTKEEFNDTITIKKNIKSSTKNWVSKHNKSLFLNIQGNLNGSLEDLQASILEYLTMALEATRDPISGRLVPTRAYRLIIGEKIYKSNKNPTSQGASLFKKLLSIHPDIVEKIIHVNPTLQEASDWITHRGAKKPKRRT